MAVTTGGLTATMSTFYSKVFLERAKLLLKHDTFAQKRGIPQNGGITVSFTRHVIPALATSGLTQALNPAGIDATGAAVTATLVDYGAYTQISSLYDRTSVDVGLEEQISVFGQHAGESIDTVIRNSLTLAGAVTGYFVSGNSTTTSSSNVVATDIVSSYHVRRVVRTLKKNKALPVVGTQGNPVFGGLIGPEAAYVKLRISAVMLIRKFSKLRETLNRDNPQRNPEMGTFNDYNGNTPVGVMG